MHRLRFGLVVVGAALALGTGGALAMESTASVSTEPDSHGDKVSAAAQSCAEGAGGVHGDCVSDVASAEGQENSTEGQENQKGARAAKVAACHNADTDKSEKTSSAHLSRTAKAADRKEDRTEHKNFVACISGHTTP
jgi:hypothetical protein